MPQQHARCVGWLAAGYRLGIHTLFWSRRAKCSPRHTHIYQLNRMYKKLQALRSYDPIRTVQNGLRRRRTRRSKRALKSIYMLRVGSSSLVRIYAITRFYVEYWLYMFTTARMVQFLHTDCNDEDCVWIGVQLATLGFIEHFKTLLIEIIVLLGGK